jgi:hypothetical protein
MDHPRPELKYVDASDLNGDGNQFDGLPVHGEDGEKLGDVEGFIIDTSVRGPQHIVVEAGWFIHKHFLIPVGYATLSEDRTRFVAELSKERVNEFPGFDKDEFEQLPSDALKDLDERMPPALHQSGPVVPIWWQSTFY